MIRLSFRVVRLTVLMTFVFGFSGSQLPGQATNQIVPTDCDNVILVTIDGLRWQEVFGGADGRLLSREGGVRNVEQTRERFWRESTEQRRETLLPFIWTTIAQQGQLYGDPTADCQAIVTNGKFFSYPGYNEILSGKSDERIASNDKVDNPNVTVLEWLNHQQDIAGDVAAFCSWDVFPAIINTRRSGVYVNAGWEPLVDGDPERIEMLNLAASEMPKVWDNVRYDYFTVQGALEYAAKHHPRVLYVAIGETDDWGHDGRYDLYLDAARRNDHYLETIWDFVQSEEFYRDRTALVITTDHGRGEGFEGWKNHGADTAGSDRIWIALLGPGVAARGVVADEVVQQDQIAQTVAQLLGKDYQSEQQGVNDALDYQQR